MANTSLKDQAATLRRQANQAKAQFDDAVVQAVELRKQANHLALVIDPDSTTADAAKEAEIQANDAEAKADSLKRQADAAEAEAVRAEEAAADDEAEAVAAAPVFEELFHRTNRSVSDDEPPLEERPTRRSLDDPTARALRLRDGQPSNVNWVPWIIGGVIAFMILVAALVLAVQISGSNASLKEASAGFQAGTVKLEQVGGLLGQVAPDVKAIKEQTAKTAGDVEDLATSFSSFQETYRIDQQKNQQALLDIKNAFSAKATADKEDADKRDAAYAAQIAGLKKDNANLASEVVKSRKAAEASSASAQKSMEAVTKVEAKVIDLGEIQKKAITVDDVENFPTWKKMHKAANKK